MLQAYRRLAAVRASGLLVGIFAGGWLTASCGSSQPGPANHGHFEAIQRQEARIDEVERDALYGETCSIRCTASHSWCDAAHRICQIAEGVDDTDADLRCEQASRRCRQVLHSHQAQCECVQPPAEALRGSRNVHGA